MTGLAALALVSTAGAATIISYTTNGPASEFVGGVNSTTLNSASGAAATLVFVGNSSSGTGTPSGIDLGDFLLSCPTCSTVQTTIFGAFTFDLMVNDTTDNATGIFVGTSMGGTVSDNSSTIQINWTSPTGLVFGPGTRNANSGNFGTTQFSLVSPTSVIVAPNSGTPPGDTTVQGLVATVVPEPATTVLIGGGLIALGTLRRKRSRNR